MVVLLFLAQKAGIAFGLAAALDSWRSIIELALLFVVVGLGVAAAKRHRHILARERRRVEEAIELKTRELAEKEVSADEQHRLKSDFLAQVSGDIRTQLTNGLGSLDLLLATKVTSEQLEYIECARKCDQSLLTIVEDMLEMARLENESIELESVQFWLADCLNSVAANAGGQVKIEIAPAVPARLIGDPYRLRQAFAKILEYFEETYGNGPLQIGASLQTGSEKPGRTTGRWLPIVFTVHRPTWRKEHATGFGSSESHGRRSGGTTLGMEVCSHLTKLMGGRLWMDTDSAGRKNVHFTGQFEVAQTGVRLPEPEAPARPSAESAGRPGEAYVLIAEDNPVNQVVVQRMLEKRGFKTIVANDGLQALKVLGSTHIDLVLMDVQMPNLDGHDTTRRIRELEKQSGAHLPIIAVTANALPADRKKCIDSGMDDYISKPVQSKHLLARVDALLEKSRQALPVS